MPLLALAVLSARAEASTARCRLAFVCAVQQDYLKAADPGSLDTFGGSTAMTEDTAVIGAIGEASAATGVDGDGSDDSEPQAGAAYVFERSGTSWWQRAYLKASNTDRNDRFGCSVAISGDTIVVGAYNESGASTGVNGDEADNSAFAAGAAYVFVREGATWTQQAYLKASNTESFDRFGWSVSVSGDTIAVGARGESSSAAGIGGDQSDNGALASGAVYVFVRTGTAWSQQAYLKASSPDGADVFGHSVCVSGDTILVGAPGEGSGATGVGGDDQDDSAPAAGAAYVFERTGSTWTQQAYLKSSNTAAGDRFGESVSLSGETSVVGAPQETNGAGAVYVFARNGAAWSEQARLATSTGAAGDELGSAIALADDTLVAGSAWATNAPGEAFVFVRSGGTWGEEARLLGSFSDPGDAFGAAVAVQANWILVGAPGEDSDGTLGDDSVFEAGAAYSFRHDSVLGTRYCSPAVPNSTGSPGRLDVLGSPIVDHDHLYLRATALPIAPAPHVNVGYFLMGTGTNVFQPPGSTGPLCVAPGVLRYLPRQSTDGFPGGGFIALPGTSGPVSSGITTGSTWNFQAWHRDLDAGTSNFTDAVSVTFE